MIKPSAPGPYANSKALSLGIYKQPPAAGRKSTCHTEHHRQSSSHGNAGVPLHQLLQPVLGRAHQLVHLLSVLPDLEVRLA